LIRNQYLEGAIMVNEYFNAVLARACEVEQKEVCGGCGTEGINPCESCMV
jgi:hypothetical protein